MPKKDASAEIKSLPGVGAATAQKLVDGKYTTVAKIAKASAKELQNVGLSAGVASKVLAAAKTASKAKTVAKKAGSATKSTAKKAATKAASRAKKAASVAKEATQKAVSKGQEVAEEVVEKTSSAATSLKTKKSDSRKGDTINVPRSVKDMPWFKKR